MAKFNTGDVVQRTSDHSFLGVNKGDIVVVEETESYGFRANGTSGVHDPDYYKLIRSVDEGFKVGDEVERLSDFSTRIKFGEQDIVSAISETGSYIGLENHGDTSGKYPLHVSNFKLITPVEARKLEDPDHKLDLDSVTKFAVAVNPQTSKALQIYAFSNNFSWASGSREPNYLGSEVLTVCCRANIIRSSSLKYVKDDGMALLTLEQAIQVIGREEQLKANGHSVRFEDDIVKAGCVEMINAHASNLGWILKEYPKIKGIQFSDEFVERKTLLKIYKQIK